LERRLSTQSLSRRYLDAIALSLIMAFPMSVDEIQILRRRGKQVAQMNENSPLFKCIQGIPPSRKEAFTNTYHESLFVQGATLRLFQQY
jgi:hypothetical protein